jgi:hypothetical protein
MNADKEFKGNSYLRLSASIGGCKLLLFLASLRLCVRPFLKYKIGESFSDPLHVCHKVSPENLLTHASMEE